MENIEQTFTIQWVGPFRSLNGLRKYLNDPVTCEKSLFSFYYISGSKKGKGHPKTKRDYRYFGIHKSPNCSITGRLNASHEHLNDFVENEYRLWIGSFADDHFQTPENVEDVETLFISTHKDVLTENQKKKKAVPRQSICVINLWYNQQEKEWRRRPSETLVLEDVILYEKEFDRFAYAKLKSRRRP